MTILKRKIKIMCNEIRRTLVNKCLGKTLIVEIVKTSAYTTFEIVDTKRRLNYGKWEVEKLSDKELKISR